MIYSKNEIYNDQTHKGVELGLGFLFRGGKLVFFSTSAPGLASTKIPSAQFP